MAGEKVLGSLSKEMTLSKMVLQIKINTMTSENVPRSHKKKKIVSTENKMLNAYSAKEQQTPFGVLWHLIYIRPAVITERVIKRLCVFTLDHMTSTRGTEVTVISVR